MTKLCLIKTNKIVPELYNMSGPFFNPVELTVEQITSMINRGVPVYEVNPYNKKETLRLNRFLANQVNFKVPVKKASVVNSNHASVVSETGYTTPRTTNYNNKRDRQKDNGPTKVKVSDF